MMAITIVTGELQYDKLIRPIHQSIEIDVSRQRFIADRRTKRVLKSSLKYDKSARCLRHVLELVRCLPSSRLDTKSRYDSANAPQSNLSTH